MKATTLILAGAAMLGAALWSCAFQVGESESVIVARLGDPSRLVEEAGLAFKLPPPIDTLIRVDRRIRILEPDPVEYLTQDKKNVLVSCFLAWSVADPIQYVRSARDLPAAESRLGDIALAELNNILGAHPLRALVSIEPETKRMEDLNRQLTTQVAERARQDFGVRIHCAKIKRLNYPRQNKEAVFRRMEAERNKIAQEIRSEGSARAERIRADAATEAALLINDAKRRAEELRGEGDAEATRIYGEAHAQDPELYEFLRTLEAYEAIFGPETTVVIPEDAPLLRLLREPPVPSAERPPAGGNDER
ncbi:MAG: protease modulator HflC [Planctomycetota bacterium]